MSRIESITVAPTTTRKAAPGRFEAALQGAAHSIGASWSAPSSSRRRPSPSAPCWPGRCAARPAAGARTGRSRPGGRVARDGRARPGDAAGHGPAGAGPGATGAGAAGSQGDLIDATRALQQEAQAMNLQYLQLQEQMQRESREFTALTNVMQVKHDSARAAISNIH